MNVKPSFFGIHGGSYASGFLSIGALFSFSGGYNLREVWAGFDISLGRWCQVAIRVPFLHASLSIRVWPDRQPTYDSSTIPRNMTPEETAVLAELQAQLAAIFVGPDECCGNDDSVIPQNAPTSPDAV